MRVLNLVPYFGILEFDDLFEFGRITKELTMRRTMRREIGIICR